VSNNHILLSHSKRFSHKFFDVCQFAQKNESRENSNISQRDHKAKAKQKEKKGIIIGGVLSFQLL
jgi:hypothetical protein